MSQTPEQKPKPPSKPKVPPDGPSIAKGDWVKKGHSAAECADGPTLRHGYRPPGAPPVGSAEYREYQRIGRNA